MACAAWHGDQAKPPPRPWAPRQPVALPGAVYLRGHSIRQADR